MLNSTEHDIYHAHKCWNANNCWHFNIYEHNEYNIWVYKSQQIFLFLYLSFYEKVKFHAELN